MCCIFTCCGWMIDLIQRFITFSMSCIIGCAVCCLFLTSVMAGVALGYNYSLAEYIDLKETNVSVYLKRGIFDDEFGEGASLRRSGGDVPISDEVNGNRGEESDGENKPLKSGRRMDQSIYESDDNNRFEGSLLKLTKGVSTTKASRAEKFDNFRRSNKFLDLSKAGIVSGSEYSPNLPPLNINPPSDDNTDTLLNQLKNAQSELNAAKSKLRKPQETYKDNVSIKKKLNPNFQPKSGRRDFMSDYSQIENIPAPYSARRSGAAPVFPLNLYSKQELDNTVDKFHIPKPVVTEGLAPRRSSASAVPVLELNTAPTRLMPKSDYSDNELFNRRYKIKSPSDNDYIDDDFNKIPVKRK